MQSQIVRGRTGELIFFFASVYLVSNLVLLDSLLLGLGIWVFFLSVWFFFLIFFIFIKGLCCLVQTTEKAFYKYT